MRYFVAASLLLSGLSLSLGGACAADFLSVATPSAVLYDQPAGKGQKVAVLSRYMPLEVVVSQGDWIKVRDPFGKLAWVEKKALVARRFLMVTGTQAEIRKAADAAAAVVFRAAQYVVLERQENVGGGWVRVRHPDGSSGFIRSIDVWGE